MIAPVAADGVVTFTDGLPGFETCRQFVIVASPDLQPFTLMHGVDATGPSFVAIDPRAIEPHYPAVLDAVNLARLAADGGDPLLWLAIVATQEDGSATANLRAPVVINPGTMRGIQLITAESAYPVNHPLQVG
jgi:flagellar assembly factor FliW